MLGRVGVDPCETRETQGGSGGGDGFNSDT